MIPDPFRPDFYLVVHFQRDMCMDTQQRLLTKVSQVVVQATIIIQMSKSQKPLE